VKIFREIVTLPEFNRDLERLLRKFRTLRDDLDNFIQTQIHLYHKLGQDNKGVFQISDLGIESPKIFKAKKFTCRSLKGRGVQSGIRVIYAYFEKEDKIMLVEIYYKGDKQSEDRNRILKHLKQ
jgi:mRNA-degrading endonuclease RelE of RelBE toxin-antitoxin system